MRSGIKAAVVATIVVLLAAVLPRSVTQAAKHHQKTLSQTIFVPARSAGENGRFLQTGFVLKKGLSLKIKATGTAYTAICSPACATDPNGNASIICPISCAGPGLVAYSLIGKVGRGHVFFIGSGPRTVSGHGRLALAYNDGNYTDNSGGYTVLLAYRCKLGTTACRSVRISRPTAGPAFTPTPTNTPMPTITPTPSPTATSTATLEPTRTPVPTATLEPTRTLVPAATLEPTQTPVPTATLSSLPTPSPTQPVYVPPPQCLPIEPDHNDNDDRGLPPGNNDRDGCPVWSIAGELAENSSLGEKASEIMQHFGAFLDAAAHATRAP